MRNEKLMSERRDTPNVSEGVLCPVVSELNSHSNYVGHTM